MMTALRCPPAPTDARDVRETEFEFGPAEFERVRLLIHRRAGISLHAGKQAMVYSRLSRRLRTLQQPSFRSYLQWLENAAGPTGEAEWEAFVNCLTTNLTSFFREEHHFPMLADALAAQPQRQWRIWCNAASTGEEPYSLAMTVAEALGTRAKVEILCTDIDTQVLAQADEAAYPVDARGLSAERRQRHFLRGTGDKAGLMRVKPELRTMVQFRPFNLMEPRWSLGAPFDIVFCRNVMIYFDASTQQAVLERMHAAMRPGSLLFAGHSENFSHARALFKLRGKTVYERLS